MKGNQEEQLLVLELLILQKSVGVRSSKADFFSKCSQMSENVPHGDH